MYIKHLNEVSALTRIILFDAASYKINLWANEKLAVMG